MRVRVFRDGDEVGINAAFNEVFHQQRSLEEWRWKFLHESYPVFVIIAEDEARNIVAHYGAVPVRVLAFGKEVLAGHIVDVFVKARTRRSLFAASVFLRLVKAFIATWGSPQHLSFSFGFPSQRPLLLGQILGEYGQIPDQIVPLYRLGTRTRVRYRLPFGLRIGCDPDAADMLWQALKERLRFSLVRDGAYVRRRYTGRPGFSYYHVVAWRRGQPSAYGIFAPQPPSLAWAELLWDGENNAQLHLVLEEAQRLAQRMGLRDIVGWLRGDPLLEEALRAEGFEVEPHPLVRWLGRSFDPRIPPELVPEALHFTMGDSDLV